VAASEASAIEPARLPEEGGAPARPQSGPLDTPEARARSVRRFLESRRGIRVEARFNDGAGEEHEVCSVPVPGGCCIFDRSANWGLRLIDVCRGEDDLGLLVSDYAAHCADQVDPQCRLLRLSDLRRPSSNGTGPA
jgi:hypothetical protein